jgi:hypothetical protein
MTIAISRICLIAGTIIVLGAATPAAADDVNAISTGGKGDLTMCSYRGCNLYHHIKLPPQLVVGGTVRVRFGSNPKHYDFPVAWIVRDGNTCTIFAQTGQTDDVTKLEIASCQVAAAAQ